MNLSDFDSARSDAKSELKNKKFLSIRDVENLLIVEKYASHIPIDQIAMLRILLEIKCAEHASEKWHLLYGRGFADILFMLHGILLNATTKKTSREFDLCQIVDSLDYIADHCDDEDSLVYQRNRDYPKQQALRVYRSILALRGAAAAVCEGDIRIFRQSDQYEMADDYDMIGDSSSMQALFAALYACGGRVGAPLQNDTPEQKQQCSINTNAYWTWYLDEAFPWAITEVNERLKQAPLALNRDMGREG